MIKAVATSEASRATSTETVLNPFFLYPSAHAEGFVLDNVQGWDASTLAIMRCSMHPYFIPCFFPAPPVPKSRRLVHSRLPVVASTILVSGKSEAHHAKEIARWPGHSRLALEAL